ncbi:MAG: peptidoglycan-binding protein [Leptolyngbyaceae cyanobacterium]
MFTTLPNPQPSTSVALLTNGSKGAAVSQLQTQLNQFYGSPLQVNGVFDAKTEAFVWTFQSACQLTTDGIVGEKTWTYLNELTPYVGLLTVRLSLGSTGSAVKYIQARLNSYFTPQPTTSYQYLALDGVFGTKTAAEVKRFQRLFALPMDGIVDADFLYYLESADMAKNHHD